MPSNYIDNLAELEGRYTTVVPNAVTKEVSELTEAHQRFILESPFMVIATSGVDGEGLDCSPRGDTPGSFVRIPDSKTILIPDRRGNNRLDSLRNIVRDPRVGLLFMIPGIGHTMRVNGTARLCVDEALRETFRFNDKVPALVIEIAVETAYSQCPKALVRSKLWADASRRTTDEIPSVGDMMAEIEPLIDGKALDDAYPERLKQTLY